MIWLGAVMYSASQDLVARQTAGMKARLVVSQDGNVPLLALVFGLIRKRATEPSALVTSAAEKEVLPISIDDAFAAEFETETHLLKALQTRSHNTS